MSTDISVDITHSKQDPIFTYPTDHFTIVHLVASLLSECEAEVDLALGQTSFVFLWKLCLKILDCIRTT